MSPPQGNRSGSVVLFLGRGQAKEERAALDAVVELARRAKVRTVCIVGSFLVHVGDPETAHAEAEAVAKLQPLVGRLVLFRASHVLSPELPSGPTTAAMGLVTPVGPVTFRQRIY